MIVKELQELLMKYNPSTKVGHCSMYTSDCFREIMGGFLIYSTDEKYHEDYWPPAADNGKDEEILYLR